jgi:hypothetical protein
LSVLSCIVRGADDVRLGGLERVVLAGRHLLQRRGVDDQIDAARGADQAVAVAHVAEEEAQAALPGIARLQLRLLELVPAEDADHARVVLGEQRLDARLAERAGAAGDEDGLAAEAHFTESMPGVERAGETSARAGGESYATTRLSEKRINQNHRCARSRM